MEKFFKELYWVIFLLVSIIVVGVLARLNGGGMDMYLQAMRINNG